MKDRWQVSENQESHITLRSKREIDAKSGVFVILDLGAELERFASDFAHISTIPEVELRIIPVLTDGTKQDAQSILVQTD